MRGYLLLISTVLVFALFQCNPERSYMDDRDARLQFSEDTVFFDTIFTSIGSATHFFKLYNEHSSFLRVDNIDLAGGEESAFRINVDGVSGTEFRSVDIAPNDSMYVFVEVTLDPNNQNDVLRIQDSITFSVNGNLQDVDLVAWGQDVHLLSNYVVEDHTIWTAEKPYLVMDAVWVDYNQVLEIEAGTMIYMHRDAFIAVYGSLRINGTLEEQVVIQGDRLEEFYEEEPGQWYGVFFLTDSLGLEGSTDNLIDHALIKNGTIGLFVNSPIDNGSPVLSIKNTEINFMSHDGILARGSSIEGENLVIGDCGNSCLELQWAGDYSFTHCTFVNYWSSFYGNRTSPVLSLFNYLPIDETSVLAGDIENASFKNCIIYGDRMNETLINKVDEGMMNYSFDHCLMRIDEDDLDYKNDPGFSNIIHNKRPLFLADSLGTGYEPDSLSPVIDAGLFSYADAEGLRYDKNANPRVIDGMPDLGAYEWQASNSDN